MKLFQGNVVAALLIAGSWAADIDERDSCGDGSQQIIQVTLGKTYEVCCPGTQTSVGDTQYCCVGGNNNNSKAKLLKRVPFCFPACSNDDSSSCITEVPVTADNYSEKVSSATASAATATSPGNSAATTTGNGAQATSPSRGAAMGRAPEPTVMPLLAGGVMIAAANVALFI